MVETQSDQLIEASWEVCNKVGGIYTFLVSKARSLTDLYKDKYILIGPYFPNKIASEFREELPSHTFKKISDELKNEGIICHFGRWLINESPYVILIDFFNYMQNCDQIKKQFWDSFKIDSLNSPYDLNEPLVWSYCVGMLVEKLAQLSAYNKITLHCQEW